MGARGAEVANLNQQTIVLNGEKVLAVKVESRDVLDHFGSAGGAGRQGLECESEFGDGVYSRVDHSGNNREGRERGIAPKRLLQYSTDRVSSMNRRSPSMMCW